MKDKVFAYGFVGVAGLLLLFSVYKTFLVPKTDVIPLDRGNQPAVKAPTEVLIPPTLSPQEREIVAAIETKTVEITDTAIAPVSILVKQYDQVQFYNRTTKSTIQVDGGSWGKVPLAPGENMTQAFREIGTFKYQIVGTELKGEVTVR